MKRVFPVMVSLVCLFLLAKAQVTQNGEKEIRELERQRFQAMERIDVATLNRILSDDLIYTHATGLRQTKAELIGVLGSGDFKYESITPGDDTRVRIFDQAAVVTGRASIRIKAHGEEQSFAICYLDVYVKQDGRWQMVAWQSSRVAP